MFLSLVFQMMILLSSLTVAKPDCLRSCRNVNISYPFGIGDGDGCYLDDRFAIDCISGKPFLRNSSLEVLNISSENSTVLVNHPTNDTCQNPNGSSVESVNLDNSPFFFSRTENVLCGLGCDTVALIRYNGSTVAGCYSSCRDKGESETKETTGCFGVECCQTRIPSSSQAFVTSALTSFDRDNKKECKRAFLVQEKWLTGNKGKPEFTNGSFQSAPVVLDWGIQDYQVSQLMIGNISRTSSCEVFADSSRTGRNSSSVLQCKCSQGYEGNPYLPFGCQDIDECKVKDICGPHMNCRNHIGSFKCYSRPKIIIIIVGLSSSLGSLFLLIAARWLYTVIKRRKESKLTEKYFKRNGGLLLQQQLTSSSGSVDRSIKMFNSKELDKATAHFNINRILGQGGQGTVYKGMLADGRIVAVKKSKVVDEAKLQEFINEMVILSQINHRNVVALLGCCLETEVPLLVYEFIPNGTLFQYLQEQNEEFPFTWDMRLRIAIEVAGALSYLHSAASLPIYHRDIKSSNILLDDKYRAKIADFGTSKSVPIDYTHVTTRVQGTFGYLDPEYF